MSDLFTRHGDQPYWVAFKLERQENGKVGKKPMNPNASGLAKSNDATTWGTLQEAQLKCEELQSQGFEALVGFHTTGAPELCFFDLDDCFDDRGQPRSWARQLLNQTGDALCHRTPSGNGLRIIVEQDDEQPVHTTLNKGQGQVELFQNTKRFVVVTDDNFEDRHQLTPCGSFVRDEVLEKASAKKPSSSMEQLLFDWGEDTGATFDSTDCVEGERSETFASDIYTMLHKGMTPTDCVRNLTGALCAEKYEAGGRLEREVQRVCEKFEREHGALPCFKTAFATEDRHDNLLVQRKQKRSTREFLGYSDIMRPVTQKWLVDGMIPQGTTGVLFGEPGTGKTFFVLHLGLSLEAGRLPFETDNVSGPPPRHHLVAIVGEGQSTLKPRIGAWCQANGHFDPNFSVLTCAENFADTASIEGLAQEVNERLDRKDPNAPVFLVVDTLSQNLIGDENGEAAVLFIRNLEMLRTKLARNGQEATAMAVHHTKKDGTDYRGASALRGNADFMLRLTNTNDPMKKRLNRYKSKVAETGTDLGLVCLREATLMKPDFLDRPTDEAEDGMSNTLLIEPHLQTVNTSQEAEQEDQFLHETYTDGIKLAAWKRQMADKFGFNPRTADRKIQPFIRKHGLRRQKGHGGAFFIHGELKPAHTDFSENAPP